MAVGDLYRIALTYRITGQINTNVFYMKNETAAAADDADKVAQLVCTPLATAYEKIICRENFNKTFTVEATKVSRIFSELGSFSVLLNADFQSGSVLPTVCAIVASMYTGFAGPSRRGRVFLGGLSGDSIASSQINPTGGTRYAAWVALMKSYFMGGALDTGMSLGVFSRKRYEIVSNPFDDYWKPVTNLAIKPEVATMHSRKLGVGS